MVKLIKNATFNLTNNFDQIMIYNEMKQENKITETYRHVFVILGTLFSIVGVFGNLISIIILLRPTTTNFKFVNRTNPKIVRSNLGSASLNHKLSSFYTYLIALSFCDLFSCIFAIFNVLEHVHPPYLDHDSIEYRSFCLFVAIYTHPIALTLQALSIWIICAFSMHRCRTIIRPSLFLTSLKKQEGQVQERSIYEKIGSCLCCCIEKESQDLNDHRSYLCEIKLKNNFNNQSTLIEFYSRSIRYLFNCKKKEPLICSYCFCVFIPEYKENGFNSDNEDIIQQPTLSSIEYEFKTFNETANRPRVNKSSENSNKLTEVRITLIFLYIAAILFMIPQFFEKKIIKIDIENQTYVFPAVTQFGKSIIFRQIFHLWFYLIAVYALPFLLILTFNFLLLRAFLKSRKKCQPYKMRKDPTDVLRDMSVDPLTQQTTDEAPSRNTKNNLLKANQTEFKMNISKDLASSSNFSLRQRSLKLNSEKKCKRSRALTMTLFGVVILFGLCHLPSIVARILYVLYPELEFHYNKSFFFALFTEFSNLLVMINSSLNFVLYIVFGPGKFRQEFQIIMFTFCSCFTKFFQKVLLLFKVTDKKDGLDSELENYSISATTSKASNSRDRFSFMKTEIEEEDESCSV